MADFYPGKERRFRNFGGFRLGQAFSASVHTIIAEQRKQIKQPYIFIVCVLEYCICMAM